MAIDKCQYVQIKYLFVHSAEENTLTNCLIEKLSFRLINNLALSSKAAWDEDGFVLLFTEVLCGKRNLI